MQNSVANTLKIIKEFILKVRVEKAFTIASIIFVLTSGSKISLYQLGIATNFNGNKLKSCEQKIRRLFDKFPITFIVYAKAVIYLFPSDSVELIIDRTNWKFGAKSINFLVLSIHCSLFAVPIYWQMLDNKGGNSSSDQRIELVKWFTTNFGKINISNIYADREFPSIKFITWLLSEKLNFLFRSKGSIKASDGNKKLSLTKIYHKLNRYQHKVKVEKEIRCIFGNRLFISARLNPEKEFMFLISNHHHTDSYGLYAKRWAIETMFGNFKTKSFDLESTHITQTHRLSALFMTLAITYCYCCKIGIIANKINPIPIKLIKQTNGTKIKRPEFTIFKYGFYLLKNFFDNYLSHDLIVAKQLCKILSEPLSTNHSRKSKTFNIFLDF